MNISKIRDYFIEKFSWSDSCSVGKIDKDKEKAVCFYSSQNPAANNTAFGGKKNTGCEQKAITILLRYGKNAVAAEAEAEEIYKFFDEKTFYIDEKRVFVISRYDSAIFLGTDEKGVYEYSFEFTFYIERMN